MWTREVLWRFTDLPSYVKSESQPASTIISFLLWIKERVHSCIVLPTTVLLAFGSLKLNKWWIAYSKDWRNIHVWFTLNGIACSPSRHHMLWTTLYDRKRKWTVSQPFRYATFEESFDLKLVGRRNEPFKRNKGSTFAEINCVWIGTKDKLETLQ